MAPGFDWVWWLCLAVLIGLFVGLLYAVYELGKLPGETAHRRNHPQASAITACGWLGLLFPPLWAVALVWAWTVPRGARPSDPAPLEEALRAMEERVAGIEQEIGLSPLGAAEP